MPIVHYLNVKEGDCSILQHSSGRVTVIDVCNARDPNQLEAKLGKALAGELAQKAAGSGNHNQKAYPENPIEYMHASGYADVFRFILTGPDMDHMDGITDFFVAFPPTNFWDTANTKEIASGAWNGSRYREQDWKYYKKLRDSDSASNPKRLVLYAGAKGKYFTEGEDGKPAGDALYVLAPTPALIEAANEEGDWNDASFSGSDSRGRSRHNPAESARSVRPERRSSTRRRERRTCWRRYQSHANPSPRAKFPANREKYREFPRIRCPGHGFRGE